MEVFRAVGHHKPCLYHSAIEVQEASFAVIMLGNLIFPPLSHQALKRSQDQQQLIMALTMGQANGSKTEKTHRLEAGKYPTTKLFPYSSSPQKSEGSGHCLTWPKACGPRAWNVETGSGCAAGQQSGPTLDAN